VSASIRTTLAPGAELVTDPGRGLFLTLEGPDGAGKSVQAAVLAERLTASGRSVLLTREPGGTPLGERIRALLLDVETGERDALAEAMLFNAARRQLVMDVIRPALDGGAVVVCDRFADSTLCYQGYGGGAPLDELRRLAEMATGGLVPDRTVLLDVAAEVGLARRRGGDAAQLTRFEVGDTHDLAFHERVREGFRRMAQEDPERWRVVDATVGPAEVSELVWQAVRDLLDGGQRA